MSDNLLYPARGRNGQERCIIEGSFAPQGVGVPTQPTGEATYCVITRSGVGVYLFTFPQKYARLIAPEFTVQLNAAAASLIVISGAVAVSTTKTFSITHLQESAGTFAAAEIAANANNRIYYRLTLAETTNTP